MVFTPSPYVPNKAVEMAHAIPRLYFTPISFDTFEISQNNFPISNQTLAFISNEPLHAIGDAMKGDQTQQFANQARYIAGLVSLPVCLVILGIVSLLIFQLCVSCRCFCKCLKCAPLEDEIENNPKKIIVARNKIVWGFWLFFVCMLAADGCLYIGNDQLHIGSGNLIKAAQSLKAIFVALIAEANVMKASSGTLNTVVQGIASGSCGNVQPQMQSAVTGMQSAVSAMQSAFSAINSILSPIPGLLDSAILNVEMYGQDLKTKALYVLFFIIIVVALLFLLGACYASKWALYLGTLLGEIVVLYSTIICGIFMIFVTFLADFCVSPADNLAKLTPEMVRDLVVFYSTCKGTAPFNADLLTMQNAVLDFADTFQTSGFETACDNSSSGTTFGADIASASSAIAGSIGVVATQSDCEPLNTVYDQFLNKGLCGNLFAGLFDVWMCVCFTSVALYFLMCYSSVMWQYFGKAWKLRPDNVHTGGHMHLVGTHLVGTTPHTPDAADAPSTGYRQEYTFTAAAPTAPTLSRSDIEMI